MYKKGGSMATFEQCQREYDNRTPDEPDNECPLCDGEMKGNKCTECNYEWPIGPEGDDDE